MREISDWLLYAIIMVVNLAAAAGFALHYGLIAPSLPTPISSDLGQNRSVGTAHDLDVQGFFAPL